MATIERQFYLSWRGPDVSDIDIWRLVFDRCTGNLVVRHQWETDRHSGLDDFGIAEFLVEQGAAQSALLTLLFDAADHYQSGPQRDDLPGARRVLGSRITYL